MATTDLSMANSTQPAVRARVSRKKIGSSQKRDRNYLLMAAYALLLGLILFFLIRGLSYYLTPLHMRPHHGDYRLLKPAGSWGLRFGIAGTLMMTCLLLYSVRKRTKLIGKKGKLKTWLNWHILCGVCGPLFILLHTSFKLNGLVALSFWAMIAVAMSGVFGRYLYQQIPRNIRGKALTVQECQAQEEAIRQQLEARYGASEAKRMQWSRPQPKSQAGLFRMIFQDLISPFQWARYRRQLSKMTPLAEEELANLYANARAIYTLQTRIRRLEKIERFFHYWHVIHLPFAFIMYTVMVIHIVVAILFGIAWEGIA